MTTAPAGWYPQPDGTQRYWDGSAWTDHIAPGAAQAADAVPPVVAATPVAPPSVAATPAADAPAVPDSAASAPLAAPPVVDAPQTLAAPPSAAAVQTGPKKRSKLPLILGIVGGVIALFVVGIVLLVLFVFKATSGPRETVNDFVAAANKDDCEGMIAVVSDNYKQMYGLESCDDYEGGDASNVKFSANETTISGSTATVSGTLTDKDSGEDFTLNFSLIKVDGDWKIDDFTSE